MKRILYLLCFANMFCSTSVLAQGEEGEQKSSKVNELGIHVFPGTYFVTGPSLFGKPKINYLLGAGAFFQQQATRHLVWRIGFNVNFEMSNYKFPAGAAQDQINYRVTYLEIPLQLLVYFNPEDRFRGYAGIGAGTRRHFSTQTTTIEHDGEKSVTSLRNNQLNLEFMPSAILGFKYQIDEQMSFYFQPEYRIVGIRKFGNAIKHGFSAQVGLTFAF
ncbi:MAG TPA: outer membrane beta-barrel protein [Taishania sp.]|nr:outer membrane beta-barrel protein [Taishania sp.]